MNKALALACAVVVCAPPPALAAQSRMQFSFGATGAQEIVQSRFDSLRERLSGMVLGGEGMVTSGRILVRLRYAQGRVTGGAGSAAAPRDLVEGEALVGLRALPWLTFWAGPHARAYASAGADQRWLFWSGRATARGTILPGRMSSFVELWQALSANVSRPAGSASGRGAEAGLEVRLSGQSLWGRLSYGIEQGQADAARRETVEVVGVSLSYAPQR